MQSSPWVHTYYVVLALRSHLLCSSPTVSDLLCVAPPVVCLLKCCDGNVGITWNQIRFDMKQFRTMNNNGITDQVCVFDWWGTGCFKAITPRPLHIDTYDPLSVGYRFLNVLYVKTTGADRFDCIWFRYNTVLWSWVECRVAPSRYLLHWCTERASQFRVMISSNGLTHRPWWLQGGGHVAFVIRFWHNTIAYIYTYTFTVWARTITPHTTYSGEHRVYLLCKMCICIVFNTIGRMTVTVRVVGL